MGKLLDAYNTLVKAGEKEPWVDRTTGDTRYRDPKEQHQVNDELIDKTISETEIYSKAKDVILQAQRKQVGYGIEKYPEPLNADTWTDIETIDHIIDESIDKLHYLVMLRIKMEQGRVTLKGGRY